MDEPPEEPHPRTSEGALTAAGLDLAALAGKGLLADLAAMPPYKSPFSESLVAGWRGSLIGASSKLQGLVAGEMAGFITRSKLPALTGFTGLAGLDTELLAKRLADQITVPLFELSTAWQKSLLAGIKPVSLLVANGFSQEMAKLGEEERAQREAVYAMGWWLPPSISWSFYRHVGHLAGQRNRLAVRQAMNEASHSREFAAIVAGWMRLPVFAARRRFLLDGFADHQRGRYRVSIPTLLPHLEGIAIAALAPGSRKTAVDEVVSRAANTFDMALGDGLVDAVTVLWADHDFTKVRASDRHLNRQVILHGRSTGYGTEVNSTKLLFAFDLLASLVREAERKRPG